jgi:hypothetical protein
MMNMKKYEIERKAFVGREDGEEKKLSRAFRCIYKATIISEKLSVLIQLL